MALSEEEHDDLISEGWRILQDVAFKGEVLLSNGDTRKATMREILAAAQFLASKRAPKSRKVPNLDGLRVERTDG